MLERARTTTLGLLGATAAVGLAIVALAANQDWPLVAGSGIPPLPPRHQSVGEATVAAGVRAPTQITAAIGQAQAPADPGSRRSAGQRDSVTPEDGGSSSFVVAQSTPVDSGGGGGRSPAQPQGAPPAIEQPQQASGTPVSAPAETPAAPSAPQPAAPAPSPPSPTTSEVDPEDDVSPPSWSNGKGHGYGQDDDWGSDDSSDDSDDWDDDHGWDGDRGWGGSGNGWHGHGRW